MGVLYLLVPLALLFAGGALWVFIVSVKRGQFDDLDTPAVRILFDDVEPDADDTGKTED
ncbi:MAG: cbb3-type cytochrome oxidase assembly protein CcoS [Chrysiogenetes bacterium]|nr:cbb3-type cytochrome oxidase assembly protein CcoS [Chrysiogenetes bacterium]